MNFFIWNKRKHSRKKWKNETIATRCVSSFVFCWRKPLVYSPGKLQYSSNSTINKSSVNRSKTLLSMFINRESRRDPELTFLLPSAKGLQMKCQPSAPLHKRASEQKEPKSIVCNIQEIKLCFVPKTPQNTFSFMSWSVSNQYSLNLLIFQFNGKWRRHSPFANRKPSDTER